MSLVRYIDCDNAYEDLLSLLKRMLVIDDDGHWWLRITALSEEDIPVSVTSGIDCGDTDSLEDILRSLIMVDPDTGELSLAIYNVEE
jgi:hypothetical protein